MMNTDKVALRLIPYNQIKQAEVSNSKVNRATGRPLQNLAVLFPSQSEPVKSCVTLQFLTDQNVWGAGEMKGDRKCCFFLQFNTTPINVLPLFWLFSVQLRLYLLGWVKMTIHRSDDPRVRCLMATLMRMKQDVQLVPSSGCYAVLLALGSSLLAQHCWT